jgi:hypothetical protein
MKVNKLHVVPPSPEIKIQAFLEKVAEFGHLKISLGELQCVPCSRGGDFQLNIHIQKRAVCAMFRGSWMLSSNGNTHPLSRLSWIP